MNRTEIAATALLLGFLNVGCNDEKETKSEENTAATCADGVDNDKDGATDCEDAACRDFCVELCEEDAIDEAPNTLEISVDTAEQVIHKEIFGLLMETLGKDINNGIYVGTDSSIPNTDGIRNDIIEGFIEAGVGAIEWPGGCAANTYNWQSSIAPSNTMGTDLFMEFCEMVDAEPVIVGRPRDTYADSNREWVEYINDNPSNPDWHLKYFKVGNEVWGCGGNLEEDEATYETWYDANYEALRAPVNGKDLFLIGATGGVWTIDPDTDNWLTTMLSPGHLADRLDGIEIHDYLYFPEDIPCVGFSDEQYYQIVHLANEGQIAPRIRDIKTILDRYDPDGRIQVILDEWGDWLIEWDSSDSWLQMGTLMDAISAAEQLHVFMANADRILMGGLAQAVNVLHSLFLTNSSRGGTDLVKTPTFYVFKMLASHHTDNARWAPSTLSSEKITENGRTFPVLSYGASVNDDEQVHISLVNVDLENTRTVHITLDSSVTSYTVSRAEVITGEAKDSYNDFGEAEQVNIQELPSSSYEICGRTLNVTLPTKSIVMLALTPE